MTTRAKQLAVVATPLGATEYLLYTCPASTRTVVKSIRATCAAGGSHLVFLLIGGVKYYVAQLPVDIAGGATVGKDTLYLVMHPGDQLKALSPAANAINSITVSGAELPAP